MQVWPTAPSPIVMDLMNLDMLIFLVDLLFTPQITPKILIDLIFPPSFVVQDQAPVEMHVFLNNNHALHEM